MLRTVCKPATGQQHLQQQPQQQQRTATTYWPCQGRVLRTQSTYYVPDVLTYWYSLLEAMRELPSQ